MPKSATKENDQDAIPLLFTLTLADDGAPTADKKYIRIPPSYRMTLMRWILQPGTLAAINQAILFTNYPEKDKPFERHTFHAIKFNQDPQLLCAYCDLLLDRPGVYEYYVKYGPDLKNTSSSSGRWVVEPHIITRSDDSLLPMDALMIQSVVPKWMGPISDWDRYFNFIQYAGYNMIHFVPMQQRGTSNSPYSIADQLTFADDLFDNPSSVSSEQRATLVKKTLKHLEQTHGILSLSDIVWNHTSNDSAFLLEHPEAGYNLHNSPHLVPAYELDTALVNLSGELDHLGLKSTIESETDVNLIIDYIKHHTFPDLKLYEYKILDVSKCVALFEQRLIDKDATGVNVKKYRDQQVHLLSLKQQAAFVIDKKWISNGKPGTRFPKQLDLPSIISFILAVNQLDDINETSKHDIEQLSKSLQILLDECNLPWYKEYDQDVCIALDNIKNRMIFTRLADNGPHLGPISKSNPLVETYFTRLEQSKSSHPPGSFQLANNGWIWNADPLVDFAGPGSSAYLRRQVIIWGDCVKLRYGSGPEDNPWLWQHMTCYTKQVASMFHGIRIDNCHSTPMHVAEYLLDAARKIRPHLYVLAELFTGSEEKDNVFVSRLGIHALIREAMQAWDTHELSRLVHRHGGKPVGSMDEDMTWKLVTYDGELKDIQYVQRIPVSHGSSPRALFMDCTHDNETPLQKRLAQDALPNAAVVAFSDCSIGSVKGYDELYPRLLDVVGEKRQYAEPDTGIGIVEIKHKLQLLHLQMSLQGYGEVHVHQENDYLLVHRQHPGSQDGYLLITRTAFSNNASTGISPIILRKSQAEFVFGASLKVDDLNVKNDAFLTGLPSHVDPLPAPALVSKQDEKGEYIQVVLDDDKFTPGSIMILKTSIGNLYEETKRMVTQLDNDVIKGLNLVDINVALYRCEGEEMEYTGGDGVYEFPGYGKLVYAGLQGFMTVLEPIIINNDLGHPVCDNLRQGKWALEYVVHRLDKYLPQYPHLQGLRDWLDSRMEKVKDMPDFLVPKYFAMTIQTAYNKIYQHALSLMSPLVQHDLFLQQLAMTSVQLLGQVPSTGLHPTESNPSLAAGLPHFTNGPFRTWGRDVFISLRGLLMVTGRFKEAKAHILSFAGSLKHGLIPNLLDSVRQPRYNARDAVWFFTQAIQDYYNMAPDGHDILNEKVLRRFPKDDRFVPVEEGYQYTSTIGEIIQEILERHAQGIHFREYNAGPAIDRQMSDEGFNIDIEVDWKTGLLVGGNAFNCGTWMDKMGESEKAHNKGLPGTSRDGAPIEISGLLKSTLRWIIELEKAGRFKWTQVKAQDGKIILYKDWNRLIQDNFERVYYIPKDPADDTKYDVDPRIVNRRTIYKDVWKASKPYTEYQLRPNFCIAMVVAPELFNKQHGQLALQLADTTIKGPLGMRTLDPSDLEYRPYYNNSDDSDDIKVAKGRNYHQGPEWLFCTGYFLRACLLFNALTPSQVARILCNHRDEIKKNPWRGLPELTNKDGAPCWDSCFTQAWSSSTLLDLFYDMIEKKSFV
ncbi:glycogen debranching enzyme [Halteromyces radiatus]|uniref:glycogen debranching enzyme n=1 Tax=Halteromyces radiatus TaxID=101107 RepID=UPI00221ECF92|nr:glycogen debranching enzyme [Halteromyces radiatus]KAI8079775.1 glycogen debranching enzyme [Halteromyces radiatus]